ncbi:hypothetical protein HMPREF0556_10032 [Listeria grayi DSM 20601]|uniref:Uncharacterized protein n=1 Tax=Listeria grayi DSM 20601 TaxID=525367 RepID=D7UU57_LISGR|nr:hypothetical protein HMPREF0556_10032 [Listeria grayi DSM 20601]
MITAFLSKKWRGANRLNLIIASEFSKFDMVYTIGFFAVNVFVLCLIIYIGIAVYRHKKKPK